MTAELPKADLRRTLRNYLGAHLENAVAGIPSDQMAGAARALDDDGTEVDRWTVSDEETMRVVENR